MANDNKENKENMEKAFRERRRLLFFGLPWTFTVYTVTEDLITIQQGLLNTHENDCYMYKVQDVELHQHLLEKLFGLGTIECFTGDTTHPDLKIVHVRRAREIKNYILENSEKARRRRRTLNTLDIGTGEMDTLDGEDL